MKRIDVVEEALQDIRDIFEDIVILKQETVDDQASWESWYQWSLEYLVDNLSIPGDKAIIYMERLNTKPNGNHKKRI
jgi:hypothetical protein